jgi:hypothetical protein
MNYIHAVSVHRKKMHYLEFDGNVRFAKTYLYAVSATAVKSIHCYTSLYAMIGQHQKGKLRLQPFYSMIGHSVLHEFIWYCLERANLVSRIPNSLGGLQINR